VGIRTPPTTNKIIDIIVLDLLVIINISRVINLKLATKM
jgi:hypothetical protein